MTDSIGESLEQRSTQQSESALWASVLWTIASQTHAACL
jgi:hypothetical protein